LLLYHSERQRIRHDHIFVGTMPTDMSKIYVGETNGLPFDLGGVMDYNFTQDELLKISQSKSYCYHKKVPSVAVTCVVSILFMLVYVGLATFFMLSGNNAAVVLTIIIGFAIMTGYIVKKMQFDTMKVLTQYFKDENGQFFKVVFTKISTRRAIIHREYSLMPLVGEVKTLINAYYAVMEKKQLLEQAEGEAKNILMGYYYVNRFKNGISDWNAWRGGEAKVIPLGKLERIGEKKYRSTYNGKTKTIKIDSNYGIDI